VLCQAALKALSHEYTFVQHYLVFSNHHLLNIHLTPTPLTAWVAHTPVQLDNEEVEELRFWFNQYFFMWLLFFILVCTPAFE
jgi:hypothetical protein